MFDQMYDCVKLHNAACSDACRPVVIHAVLMSIIFEHYKQLTKLMEQRKAKEKAVIVLLIRQNANNLYFISIYTSYMRVGECLTILL